MFLSTANVVDYGCELSGRTAGPRSAVSGRRSGEGYSRYGCHNPGGQTGVDIPLVLVVVLGVSALVVMRLHKIFGSQDLNAGAGAGIEIVQFNPKVVVLRGLRPRREHREHQTTGTQTPTHTRSMLAPLAVVVTRSRRRCPRLAPTSWRKSDGDPNQLPDHRRRCRARAAKGRWPQRSDLLPGEVRNERPQPQEPGGRRRH